MGYKHQDVEYLRKLSDFLKEEYPDVMFVEAAYLVAAIYKHYHESSKKGNDVDQRLGQAGYDIAMGKFFMPSTVEERFKILTERVNQELQYEVNKLMSYQEFLASDYWKTIREFVFYTRGRRCQLCNTSDAILDVHHSTYEHHGREHNHLGDLIILCRDCHGKFHDKLSM